MRKLKGDSSKASEDIAPKCRQILRTFVFFFGGGGPEVEKSVKEKQAKSGEKTTFSRSPFVWLVPSNWEPRTSRLDQNFLFWRLPKPGTTKKITYML